MLFPRRAALLMVLVLLCLAGAGCTLFNKLQPYQLQKLNRGPAYSEDPFFSVPDPLPDPS